MTPLRIRTNFVDQPPADQAGRTGLSKFASNVLPRSKDVECQQDLSIPTQHFPVNI